VPLPPQQATALTNDRTAPPVRPVPESATVSGVRTPTPTLRLAERAPVAVGVNITETVQLDITRRQSLVCEKSPGLEPERLIDRMKRCGELVTVTDSGALLCPTAVSGKESEDGDTLIWAITGLPVSSKATRSTLRNIVRLSFSYIL
jgi:hypothetical protein